MFLSIFLRKSDISSMLQVTSVCWESRLQPCEVQRAAWRRLQQSQTQRAHEAQKSDLNTQTSSDKLWIGKSFLMWGIFTREKSEGCSSWRPGLALSPGHTHSTCPCTIRNWPKANAKKKGRKTAIMDFGEVQGVLNRTQLITYWSTDKFCHFFIHLTFLFHTNGSHWGNNGC